MAILGPLRRAGVALFFFVLVREAAGTSADGTPMMSPPLPKAQSAAAAVVARMVARERGARGGARARR